MVQMVRFHLSPLVVEGYEYYHKSRLRHEIRSDFAYYFGTDFRTFARRGFPYYQRSDLCWRDRGDADAVRQGR